MPNAAQSACKTQWGSHRKETYHFCQNSSSRLVREQRQPAAFLGWGAVCQGGPRAVSAHPNSHHPAEPDHNRQSLGPVTVFINSPDTFGEQQDRAGSLQQDPTSNGQIWDRRPALLWCCWSGDRWPQAGLKWSLGPWAG